MYRICALSLGLLVSPAGPFAVSLPPLTSNPWDLTYGSNDTLTGVSPAGAMVDLSIPGVMLCWHGRCGWRATGD